jgi:hypothetical protein
MVVQGQVQVQVLVQVPVLVLLSLQHVEQGVERSEQEQEPVPGQTLQVFYHNCNPSYNERRK